MKKLALLFTVAALSLMTISSCKKETVSPTEGPKYQSFNSAMLKLWSDHMQWTYATVDAFFHNQSGLQAQLDRLLQNQRDIGDAIKPYYGTAAGDTLTALLTIHIQQAVPVLTAAQNNDQAALNSALTNWNQNAKDIAKFLSDANPENWPYATIEHSMLHHIEQTTTYSVDLLSNNYSQAIIHYDLAHNHMMETAELLAKGIALQFPDQF
jgi:hypothetical protein